MSPEVLVSLIQLGATGLLGAVIWFGQEQMKSQMAVINTFAAQQQQIINKLVDAAIQEEMAKVACHKLDVP